MFDFDRCELQAILLFATGKNDDCHHNTPRYRFYQSIAQKAQARINVLENPNSIPDGAPLVDKTKPGFAYNSSETIELTLMNLRSLVLDVHE